MQVPVLESERTTIRLANLDDVCAIVRYYTDNRQHLAPFEPVRDKEFYTEVFWREEVRDRIADFWSDRSLKLFIFPKENEPEIIGSINFSNVIRGVFQSCTLGYSIAKTEEGKGLMKEALEVAIDYVFSELNLHRIMASYLPRNQRSGCLLKSLGFKVEGYAYDYLKIDGRWQDHILTSLINPRWRPIR